LRYNVKSFIDVYGSRIFEKGLVKSIKLDCNFQYDRHSNPTIFGTAYNILFDYELYRRNFIESYEPKRLKNKAMNKDFREVIAKIDQRSLLNERDLLLLVKEENLYRNGNFVVYDMDFKKDEIIAMKDDMRFIYPSIYDFFNEFKTSDKIIDNPYFEYNDYVRHIYGDGDFIINDILFEIKCVSDDSISTKTIKQLYIYKLLNDYSSRDLKYEINRFGYLNPLKNQVYIWDCDIPESIIRLFKEFIGSEELF
jgi:hypothetical protein